MLYERIEEKGIDYVLSKYSRTQRDRYLEQTPSEELVMYSIIGLTPKEMALLFSRGTLQKEFSRLPPENLFYSFDTLQGAIRMNSIFEEIDVYTFLSEYRKTPYVLFKLLDTKVITISDVLRKLMYTKLETISKLKAYHPRFAEIWKHLARLVSSCVFPIRKGMGWKQEGEGVREAAARAYSRDIAEYIVTFI